MRAGPTAAVAAAAVVGIAAACSSEHHFEPPNREEQVEQADSLFTPALFDTVTWASDSARAIQGNIVYSSDCRRCHGTLGRGVTDYTRERGLRVPSLVTPEWPYAGDLDRVRRKIFIGHPEGMPTWGVAGITPREIDAAAYYVLYVLRPDVLGSGGG